MKRLINGIEFDSDELIYLTSPFTSDDQSVELARLNQAISAQRCLLEMGLKVFGPLIHSLPFLAIPHKQWMAIDCDILKACQVLVVLMLDGWKESKGVRIVIGKAEDLDISIEYLTPDAILTASQQSTTIPSKHSNGDEPLEY